MSKQGNRLHELDGLRGFALFGILIANIQFFSGWTFADETLKTALAGPHFHLFDQLNIIFIDGKFYTVFSLLFGIGFAIQLESFKTKGLNSKVIYLRRLFILFMIGFVHLYFFWVGDILSTYAFVGLCLLAFYRSSDRFILFAAALSFCIPLFGYLLAWYITLPMDLGFYAIGQAGLDANIENFRGDFIAVFASENWHDFFAFNQSGTWIRLGYLLESWRLFKLLFIMLIGLWVGRQIIHHQLLQNKILMKKVAIWGVLIGLPMSFVYANLGVVTAFAGPPDLQGFFRMLAYMLSVFPLGFAYAALFVLAWQRKTKLFKIFNDTGRMALTNYLLQTAMCTAIFYGIGLGFVGTFQPLAFLALTVLLFVIQMIISTLWLRFFKFGPFEWIWRYLTYGKVPKLRA